VHGLQNIVSYFHPTPEGNTTISLRIGDLADYTGHALVTPVDLHLNVTDNPDSQSVRRKGGAALADAVNSLQQDPPDGQAPDNRRAKWKEGRAVHTTGGSLHVSHVIHAVEPDTSSYDKKITVAGFQKACSVLQDTLWASFNEAYRQGHKSVAIPLLMKGERRGEQARQIVLNTTISCMRQAQVYGIEDLCLVMADPESITWSFNPFLEGIPDHDVQPSYPTTKEGVFPADLTNEDRQRIQKHKRIRERERNSGTVIGV
jgi:hypothetical protein